MLAAVIAEFKKAKLLLNFQEDIQNLLKSGNGGFSDEKADWRAVDILSFNGFDKEIAQVILIINNSFSLIFVSHCLSSSFNNEDFVLPGISLLPSI